MDTNLLAPAGRLAAADVVSAARAAFADGRTLSLTWRREQLAGLHDLLTQHAQLLADALAADLGKPATESWVTEIGYLLDKIAHVDDHLEEWIADEPAPVPVHLRPARAWIQHQPLGVVLVIAPWNYPLQLALAPLVGALAAGNAAVLKPSEVAPTVAETLASLVPAYLDPEAVQVVQGGPEETGLLLEQRFDHIFYTGNGVVGRVVARAAAEHLTPITLELGGKSPVFVDDTVPARTVAERLAWAKFTNAGQTCVAPDYVLATPEVAPRLVEELGAAIARMYGQDPAASDSYGRIVNERHHRRLTALLEGQTAAVGGQHDIEDLYIAPTVLTGVDPGSPVMSEEIFGPLLPVLTVADAQEAVEIVRGRDKPLALYLFTTSRQTRELFAEQTSSGGMAVNAAMLHLAVPGLPFGGVGESGTGAYHGRDSVLTFSHRRAVLSKGLRPDTLAMTYPPYTGWKRTLLTRLMGRGRRPQA